MTTAIPDRKPLMLWLGQITGRPLDSRASREHTLHVAEGAFAAGARVILLPELIVPGYVLDRDAQRGCAETIAGPSVRAWQALCVARGGYIAAGFTEFADGKLFNSAVLVGPDGVLLHYRKLHLFDEEKAIFSPGDRGLPVATTPIGRLGLCVCYDLRFVEVARALALRGAECILVPTAWVAGFDRNAWDGEGYCSQARGAALQANLNQVFIACASQVGETGLLRFLGSSLVADPYGSTIAGPFSGTTQQGALVALDLDDSVRAQRRSERITPRADRRRDVYGLWFEGELL
jgi:N-carbamoylputrescine amidase